MVRLNSARCGTVDDGKPCSNAQTAAINPCSRLTSVNNTLIYDVEDKGFVDTVSHAKHEDAITNVRSTRDLPSIMAVFRSG